MVVKCESTIENFFLIWISRYFKKIFSDNTISYFDKSFRFSTSLASDLFWPKIWGDLVKISRREQRENKYIFFQFSTVNPKIFQRVLTDSAVLLKSDPLSSPVFGISPKICIILQHSAVFPGNLSLHPSYIPCTARFSYSTVFCRSYHVHCAKTLCNCH